MQQLPVSVLRNAQLVDIFAAVLNLEPHRKKSLIGNICFLDSVDEDGSGGMWSPSRDFTSGGRLGRDHTLSDVPNHFIRDFLLEQIDQSVNEAAELSEDQRQTARRTLLPDLTADEVNNYCEALAKQREEVHRAYRAKHGIPEEDATPEHIRKCRLKRIMLRYGLEKERQAEDILKQEEVVAAIDTTVDLTPCVRPDTVRDYGKYGPLRRSVIFPSPWPGRTRIEAELAPPAYIDWECDQIRSMIRRFCFCEGEGQRSYDWEDSEFDLDEFQKALAISRQTLTAFLKKRGPENGDKSQAYELAWEFFKRRALLGYPLTKGEKKEGKAPWRETSSEDGTEGNRDEDMEEVGVLRASDSNRRPFKRRIHEPHSDEDSSKRPKSTRCRAE